MTAPRYAKLGSISSGTLRTEDLLPTFIDELKRHDPERATAFEQEYDALDLDTTEGTEQADVMLNEELFWALEEFAPPFCYFGTHEGDAADFGFWFSEEAFNDAVHAGEVLKLKAGDACPEYVAYVTDHGNISLYSVSDPTTPIWEIV